MGFYHSDQGKTQPPGSPAINATFEWRRGEINIHHLAIRLREARLAPPPWLRDDLLWWKCDRAADAGLAPTRCRVKPSKGRSPSFFRPTMPPSCWLAVVERKPERSPDHGDQINSPPSKGRKGCQCAAHCVSAPHWCYDYSFNWTMSAKQLPWMPSRIKKKRRAPLVER